MSEEDKKNTPVVRISIASAVGSTKQMSFETYVDVLTPKEVMDELVDRCMAVVDRQIAFYEIIDLEKLLKKATDELEAMSGDLERVDKMHAEKQAADGTRMGYKLNPKEKAERGNILQNIIVRKKYLDTLKLDIQARKEKVGAK